MGQHKRERRRRDAVDTAGLAERRRANGVEFLRSFRRHAAHGGIIHVGRQPERFVAPEGGNIRPLAAKITGILGIVLQLLDDIRWDVDQIRPQGQQVAEAEPRQCEQLMRVATSGIDADLHTGRASQPTEARVRTSR